MPRLQIHDYMSVRQYVISDPSIFNYSQRIEDTICDQNFRLTFECIREAGIKLTMHKCHFGATEIDFLGRTITPEGVKPQKESITNFLEKTKLPKSKKALQRYLGFLNYYRNYIPRLSEKLVPFFQLLKKDEKVLVTSELIEQFNEIKRDLDRCSQLALRQPLLNRQLILMTDASFTAAGYPILTEDDPNQKFTSVKKSYAPIAFGSKTFIPSQLKMSIYAKEFLAIYSHRFLAATNGKSLYSNL